MTPLEEAVERTIREWVWTRRHNGNSELIGADQAAKRIALLPEIVKMQEAQWLSPKEAARDGRYVFFVLKDIYSDSDRDGPKFKFALSYFDQKTSSFPNTGWSSHWTPVLCMNTPDGDVIRQAYAALQPLKKEAE